MLHAVPPIVKHDQKQTGSVCHHAINAPIRASGGQWKAWWEDKRKHSARLLVGGKWPQSLIFMMCQRRALNDIRSVYMTQIAWRQQTPNSVWKNLAKQCFSWGLVKIKHTNNSNGWVYQYIITLNGKITKNGSQIVANVLNLIKKCLSCLDLCYANVNKACQRPVTEPVRGVKLILITDNCQLVKTGLFKWI